MGIDPTAQKLKADQIHGSKRGCRTGCPTGWADGVPDGARRSARRGQTGCPKIGLSRGRFRTDGRTDDRTMATGASVTWTHCSVLFEVTWGKTAASARTRVRPLACVRADANMRPRGRAASRSWMPRDYIRGPQTFHSHFLRRLGLEKLRCVWCTSWSRL
jgi:hypothetical protein